MRYHMLIQKSYSSTECGHVTVLVFLYFFHKLGVSGDFWHMTMI